MALSTLVHIGYHKTGSTWLQRRLFSSEEAGFVTPWTWHELMWWFVYQNPLVYDPVATREFFAEAERKAIDAGRIPVASDERLSGVPYSGGYDSLRIARRLHDAFPDARVLIVVREQRSAILSIYKQYVRDGGPCSLRRFIQPPRSGSFFFPQFQMEFYEYHLLVEQYHRYFGAERVLTLPFEMMQRDLEGFTSRILEFAGARPLRAVSRSRDNPALSGPTVALKRRFNFLFLSSALNPGGLIESTKFIHATREAFNLFDRLVPRALRTASDARMTRMISRLTRDRFRESNQCLQAMMNMNLADFGYDV